MITTAGKYIKDQLSAEIRASEYFSEGPEGGDPDPAFPPLFHENSASRAFFISFPNPAFLSQKNALKSLIYIKANKCKM